MFEEPLEETIQVDLEKDAYLRKKISLKRLTIFVFIIDAVLAVYVILQIIALINAMTN